jgi:hypothetical protein
MPVAVGAAAPDARDDVFRCPFCYFLIKNTGAMVLNKTGNAGKQGQAPAGMTTFAMMLRENIPDIDGSCGHCHNIFLHCPESRNQPLPDESLFELRHVLGLGMR